VSLASWPEEKDPADGQSLVPPPPDARHGVGLSLP
jgi:hypothetical protein